MQPLQDLHDGDHGSAPAGAAEAPDGVLEDPRALAADPAGPIARFGPHVGHPEKRQLDDTQWWYFRFEYFEWRYYAARALLLQRARVVDLLAPNLFLLTGIHRPSWHPRPGVDRAEIAFVPWPPDGVAPTSLMLRLVTSVRG
jgi:hypothetical protein